MKKNIRIALMLAAVLILTTFAFTFSFATDTKTIGTNAFTVKINSQYKPVDLGLG